MNITELLDNYGVPYAQAGESHHATKGWLNLNCPNCDQGRDDGFHLGYNIRGKYLSCWRCGYLPLGKTLAELGLPWDEARQLSGLPDNIRRIEKKSKGILKLPKCYAGLIPIHREYLNSRGFNPDQLSKIWNLMSIGLEKRLAWRILIPVMHQWVTVSWTTRSIKDSGARYINAKPEEESIPIKQLLFGSDHVRHSTIVTEGPFDAMRIGPGAVSLLGVNYSKSQLLKLSKIPIRHICFDSDSAGQKRARIIADELSVFPGRTNIITLDAKDPGEAPTKEILTLRKLLK